MLPETYKKSDGRYTMGIHSDWPCLELQPIDCKDKKGNRKIKLPICTSTGWGRRVFKNQVGLVYSDYDISLPRGDHVKHILYPPPVDKGFDFD